ncbi:glycosyltransferase [Clostridium sp. BJN0001]|uniref:MGDG synthase family glycosyltransferase n=1 Tax=Clostridium sp. BJN0001 TaxID=2930219 RepID=UPI001FD55512|nr:glycosyltransferase [Clostridium sp. BJN0001]
MKRILILTTSTGQGHNIAAASIENSFKNAGYEVIKHDFLKGNSKFLNDSFVEGYKILATKFPKLYGLLYDFTDSTYINKFLKIPFFITKLKVKKKIKKIKPDLIIATHSISVNVIEDLKKNGLNIPYILVVTDFKAHYLYISNYVDAYITGSEYTKKTLIDRNIPESKIYPIGIPINKKFYTFTKKEDLVDKDNYFNILLMSGSFGLNDTSYVLKTLIKNNHKLRIIVVCGKNETLKNSLTEFIKRSEYTDKKIHILGFSTDIPYIMEYSDIIISKPGGLTVTESIVKNLPLIIPFSIPGQEKENIDFLVNSGCALCPSTYDEINILVDNLIDNKDSFLSIKERLKSLSSTYSLSKIVSIGKNLIENFNNKK